MKKVHLEELVNLSSIIEFNIALLKMIDPRATGILNMGRKTLIYPRVIDFTKNTRSL
jgi:hypothetical protein